MSPTHLEAVRLMREHNLQVIPLATRKKTPLKDVPWNSVERRGTCLVLRRWLTADKQTKSGTQPWPLGCNIGIRTGREQGLVVVDCESKEKAIEHWNRSGGVSCSIVRTPRGYHFYYRYPEENVSNYQGLGFDIRGNGGMVVAPPSYVVADGNTVKTTGWYKWHREFDWSVMGYYDPQWFPEAQVKTHQRREFHTPFPVDKRVGAPVKYIESIQAVSGKRGHSATWRAVNVLKRGGVSYEEAVKVMSGWNKTNASPPWSERELMHKINDCYQQKF